MIDCVIFWCGYIMGGVIFGLIFYRIGNRKGLEEGIDYTFNRLAEDGYIIFDMGRDNKDEDNNIKAEIKNFSDYKKKGEK